MRRTWVRRLSIGVASVIAALGLTTLISVGLVETRCRGTGPIAISTYKSLIAPTARRDAVNTYLTYPEWSIVHAYEDLAGIMRSGSESDFDYFGHVSRFWSSLCQLKRKVAGIGPVSFDYNSMLYTIGLSFTAEMLVQGLYEKSLGRITAIIGGKAKTSEDAFALAVADDYAKFLHQVPWYEYPFGATL
ncbi:MAG: hypothetical protein JSS20_05935, partial [Proteobacteria bacterium]|nr:hypothetical protein [Pseudomonadota bacterium]